MLKFTQILPSGNPFDWGWQQMADVVTNIINLLLMLTAGVAIIYLIIGGYKYITAFGNPEGIQQAKNTVLWAILGLILALLAVAIVNYIGTVIESSPSPLPL